MRPSLMEAVRWIAYNDDAAELNRDNVEKSVTVGMVADLFGKSIPEIARHVVIIRKANNGPAKG